MQTMWDTRPLPIDIDGTTRPLSKGRAPLRLHDRGRAGGQRPGLSREASRRSSPSRATSAGPRSIFRSPSAKRGPTAPGLVSRTPRRSDAVSPPGCDDRQPNQPVAGYAHLHSRLRRALSIWRAQHPHPARRYAAHTARRPNAHRLSRSRIGRTCRGDSRNGVGALRQRRRRRHRYSFGWSAR